MLGEEVEVINAICHYMERRRRIVVGRIRVRVGIALGRISIKEEKIIYRIIVWRGMILDLIGVRVVKKIFV